MCCHAKYVDGYGILSNVEDNFDLKKKKKKKNES